MYSIENAMFKDFTHLYTSNYENLQCSPYVRITNETSGITRLVKKSTIVWFLEHGVKKISNDRRLRVMRASQNKIECWSTKSKSANFCKSETIALCMCSVCVLWCVDRSPFLIGRILSLAFKENLSKSLALWQCDLSDESEKMAALCLWYEAKTVRNRLTGTILPVDVLTHGFHPCDTYMCTVLSPEFKIIKTVKHSWL